MFSSDRKCPVRRKPLARPEVGEFPPKSEIPEEKKRTDHNYAKSMKEESRAKTGRKPKSDPADYKYSFRLNAGENMRFEKLVTESEAKRQNTFHQKAIFGGTIKVVKIDKATMDYYIRLTEFHKQFQAVGNNYNQVVRAIRSNFGEKRAMSLLYKLEKMTLELMLLNKKSDSTNRRIPKEMVAKISHGASLYGALHYNHEKIEKGRLKYSPATG